MRDKDLRRVAALVYWHRTGKRPKAFRSEKEEWSAIRALDYFLRVAAEEGYIGHEEK